MRLKTSILGIRALSPQILDFDGSLGRLMEQFLTVKMALQGSDRF
jgi:hypothetical protein